MVLVVVVMSGAVWVLVLATTSVLVSVVLAIVTVFETVHTQTNEGNFVKLN